MGMIKFENGLVKVTGDSLYGIKFEDYEKSQGRVSYATLAKSFDCILANEISKDYEYFAVVNGSEHYEDEDSEDGEDIWVDVYQYYIISDRGYQILENLTDELVWYDNRLGVFVWGITHYGTSWDYVLTDIVIENKEEN